MLWIALYLPELSVQLATRGMPATDTPLAIYEGPDNRPVIFAVNATGRDAGVSVGMPLAAARAMVNALKPQAREPQQEDAALGNLASWALQFTPMVSVVSQQGLLLEVSASLMLFGGIAQLSAQIRKGVHELGYRSAIGVAPTAQGAWLLAKASALKPGVRSCIDLALLRSRLAEVPVELFDWPEEKRAALSELGIHTIADCIALPRDGLARRLGDDVLADLDRALGQKPDPRAPFEPAQRFSARLELPAEASEAEALLFPLRRLLLEMEGFLRGRGAGIQTLVLVMEHVRGVRTRLEVGVSSPERDHARFLTLVREKFARAPLAAPAVAIAVHADTLLPFKAHNESFLRDRESDTVDWQHLEDRLRSRLGESKVFAVQAADDHRPERAWRVAATRSPKSREPLPGTAPRPLMLLERPRALESQGGEPCYHGALQLLAGPERIEAGWWDGQRVGRDYFVARNTRGETLWVYREHRTDRKWYLHGVFS
jgi:protein ImuB